MNLQLSSRKPDVPPPLLEQEGTLEAVRGGFNHSVVGNFMLREQDSVRLYKNYSQRNMTKKYLVHVPVEQYGFISCELEGTAEEAIQEYEEIANAFKPQDGLKAREFCLFIDTYLATGAPPIGGLDLWAQMSVDQKLVVNEIKKCFNRLKNK